MSANLPDTTNPPRNRKKRSKPSTKQKEPRNMLGFHRREVIKGNWTEEEDHKLRGIIQRYELHDDKDSPSLAKRFAPTRWADIAKELPGRVGKQCRERWNNHLHPDVKKGSWTLLEEVTIYVCWRKWGSQWARISRILGGRSDNRVKNHWNCHMRRIIARNTDYASLLDVLYTQLNIEDGSQEAELRNVLLPQIEKCLQSHSDSMRKLTISGESDNRKRKHKRALSPTAEHTSHQPSKSKRPNLAHHNNSKTQYPDINEEWLKANLGKVKRSRLSAPTIEKHEPTVESDSESSDWRAGCGVWARSPPRRTPAPVVPNPARGSCTCPCHSFVTSTQQIVIPQLEKRAEPKNTSYVIQIQPELHRCQSEKRWTKLDELLKAA